jgi:hypothetical protein
MNRRLVVGILVALSMSVTSAFATPTPNVCTPKGFDPYTGNYTTSCGTTHLAGVNDAVEIAQHPCVPSLEPATGVLSCGPVSVELVGTNDVDTVVTAIPGIIAAFEDAALSGQNIVACGVDTACIPVATGDMAVRAIAAALIAVLVACGIFGC